MRIILKNKETLLCDEFKFKCSIGKNGLKKNKKEGDNATPRGTFLLGDIYYRADRLNKPVSNLKVKMIKKNTGWCDDPNSKYYNKEILINKNLKINYEKLYRRDHKYDLLILVKYNYNRVIKNKGSAIFIHLTKDYFPTEGCIVLDKKDFLILTKIVQKNEKIKIN
jgi:L,D-peptidoglycan transpeptidase YkuD (ErfK/YbiS/YcfS/YnhG family)|tara:strand:- start:38 stop:535 length:498 start_codon:yes stop_codon:yes gene_type:complete